MTRSKVEQMISGFILPVRSTALTSEERALFPGVPTYDEIFSDHKPQQLIRSDLRIATYNASVAGTSPGGGPFCGQNALNPDSRAISDIYKYAPMQHEEQKIMEDERKERVLSVVDKLIEHNDIVCLQEVDQFFLAKRQLPEDWMFEFSEEGGLATLWNSKVVKRVDGQQEQSTEVLRTNFCYAENNSRNLVIMNAHLGYTGQVENSKKKMESFFTDVESNGIDRMIVGDLNTPTPTKDDALHHNGTHIALMDGHVGTCDGFFTYHEGVLTSHDGNVIDEKTGLPIDRPPVTVELACTYNFYEEFIASDNCKFGDFNNRLEDLNLNVSSIRKEKNICNVARATITLSDNNSDIEAMLLKEFRYVEQIWNNGSIQYRVYPQLEVADYKASLLKDFKNQVVPGYLADIQATISDATPWNKAKMEVILNSVTPNNALSSENIQQLSNGIDLDHILANISTKSEQRAAVQQEVTRLRTFPLVIFTYFKANKIQAALNIVSDGESCFDNQQLREALKPMFWGLVNSQAKMEDACSAFVINRPPIPKPAALDNPGLKLDENLKARAEATRLQSKSPKDTIDRNLGGGIELQTTPTQLSQFATKGDGENTTKSTIDARAQMKDIREKEDLTVIDDIDVTSSQSKTMS